MYDWRKMPEPMRTRVLSERKVYRRPWHAPPHFEYKGTEQFIITAAGFEHRHIIGTSAERMNQCESELLDICEQLSAHLFAWCVLPDHYHLLTETDRIKELLKRLGLFHGRSAYQWNGEDNSRGRKVWYRCVERSMRSERHYFATLNYIHHNPVKHGYVTKWQDWPFSSGREYLEKIGVDEASRIWRGFPVLDYGKEWDVD
jgi:putative transposase